MVKKVATDPIYQRRRFDGSWIDSTKEEYDDEDDWLRRVVHKDPVEISDAAISACALMIKGICVTHEAHEWLPKIESRIRFMLYGRKDKS